MAEGRDTAQEILTSMAGQVLERPVSALLQWILSRIFGKAESTIGDRGSVMFAGIPAEDMNAFKRGLKDANLPAETRKRYLGVLKNKLPREKQNIYVRDLVRTGTDGDGKIIRNPKEIAELITFDANMDSEEFAAILMISNTDKPSPHRKMARKLERELRVHLKPATEWLRKENARRRRRLGLRRYIPIFSRR